MEASYGNPRISQARARLALAPPGPEPRYGRRSAGGQTWGHGIIFGTTGVERCAAVAAAR